MATYDERAPMRFRLNMVYWRLYHGDGSERCVVCGWRGRPSYYVGREGELTDDGLPERWPVCSGEHAERWATVWHESHPTAAA